jgi:hypothetical protein
MSDSLNKPLGAENMHKDGEAITMRHKNKRPKRFGWLAALLLCCGMGTACRAQEAYTSGDNNFGFKYPKRWRAEADGEKIHLISPDGSRFLVQKDALKMLPAGPPAYDSGLKEEATRLAVRLLPKAELVRGQTAVVDHGSGAVFRFQEKNRGDDAPVVSVWVAIIGTHSVVIVPEKAAQAGEAIGLSTVIQSILFADSLPKPPPARLNSGGRSLTGAGTATGAGNMASGPHTVSYQTQIAPLLNQRCRACHNVGSALGGLNVGSFADFVKGGDHGALLTPGKPGASSLMDYLSGKRDRMPKGSAPLLDDQIALFRTWIQEGATDDAAAGKSDPMRDPTVAPAGVRRAKRVKPNNPETAGAALMEGYAGHLVVTDASFNLTLLRNGTATADWTFSPTVTSHFTGSYRGADGSYSVSLTLASGSNPYQAKTLVLEMRPHGEAEIGRFGLDTDQPRRDIAALALSRFDVNFKQGGAAAKRGKNGRPR